MFCKISFSTEHKKVKSIFKKEKIILKIPAIDFLSKLKCDSKIYDDAVCRYFSLIFHEN